MDTARKHHIWCLYFLVGLFLLLISGCGLPDYISIEPPAKIDTGTSETLIGFTTPSDDSDINGYMLYYKIYTDFSEYVSDESYFDNSNDELKSGYTLPRQLGFARVGGNHNGRVLPGTSSGYNIPHDDIEGTSPKADSPIDVLIDFNRTNVSDPNDREEPQVFADDNGDNSSDSWVANSMGITLARGYYDPISQIEPLRYFVNDWFFEEEGGDFDWDLYDPAPSSQPNGSDSWTGTPLVTESNIPTDLYVGFVVFSTGQDPSSFTFVESVPVHLGYISYSSIYKTAR